MEGLLVNFQRRKYWCGVAALQNALECVGIDKTQGAISKLMVVTKDGETVEDEEAGLGGTPEDELKRGILACGAAYWEIHEPQSIGAFECLHKALDEYGPVIICVADEEHWVTVIGRCGPRYIVFDPENGEGLKVYDAHSLNTWWRVSEKGGGPYYYALAVADESTA